MDLNLLTIPEAAKKSRFSPSWWRQKIRRREVRYVRIGRRVFVPESTIRELIESGTVQPKEQTQGIAGE